MGNPKNKPTNFIELGAAEAHKSFIKGAESVNASFGSLAGNQLQSGDGRLMKQFNANGRAIKKLKEK